MFDLTSALFPETATPKLRAAPDAPLQQSALYARAVALLGAETRFLALPGMGAWVIDRSWPVLGRVALISRGPANLPARTAAVLLRASGAQHLIVTAEDQTSADELQANGFWRIAKPRGVAELALTPSTDAMALGLGQKWRNRLRHAMRNDLSVTRTPLPPAPRHWIFTADAVQARALRYRPAPPAVIAALAAAKPGAAQLFVARKSGTPVAAMLFLRHGRVATYQIGWSTRRGRDLSAGNLLMWRAMVDLQAMGIDRLDLGAAEPDQAPGLARFKAGTGAQLRKLGGTWLCSTALPRRSNPFRTHAALSCHSPQ